MSPITANAAGRRPRLHHFTVSAATVPITSKLFHRLQTRRRLSVGPHSPQRTGSLNVNVEPTPTWLVTQILPPCNSTNFRDWARPSPVPSTFLAAVPTCRNSSSRSAPPEAEQRGRVF